MNKRRLLRSSAIFATSSSGFLAADAALAEVVPFIPPGGPIQYSHSANERLDLNGDFESDFAVVASAGVFNLSDYFGALGISNSNRILNLDYFAAILSPGDIVGPDSTGWINDASLDHFVGIRNYVGVVFDIPGGSPHFGYLNVGIDPLGQTLTVYGGAFESSANTPIQIVPEPQSLAMLATGAAGLGTWRRKKA